MAGELQGRASEWFDLGGADDGHEAQDDVACRPRPHRPRDDSLVRAQNRSKVMHKRGSRGASQEICTALLEAGQATDPGHQLQASKKKAASASAVCQGGDSMKRKDRREGSDPSALGPHDDTISRLRGGRRADVVCPTGVAFSSRFSHRACELPS